LTPYKLKKKHCVIMCCI